MNLDTIKMPSNFRMSTNTSDVDIDAVHSFLSRAYWCEGIPKETVAKAINNSMCFSVFNHNQQIAFARIISDKATFAYLCDVYVLEEYRGQGVSKKLLECIMSHPDLQGLRRWSLATRDAHTLYEKYGFTPLKAPDRYMERLTPNIYKIS